MNKSEILAKALILDYRNPPILGKIEKAKSNDWQNPEAFWEKIITNQMHVGSNGKTLIKRMKIDEFKAASNFAKFSHIDKHFQIELLDKFVPGGRKVSKLMKIERLITAVDMIRSNGGLEQMFNPKKTKDEIIEILTSINGIAAKQARNIPMDLYHPAFRNGSIPIDENWKNIAKYLGYNWSKSEKHEKDIIEWRNIYIGRDIIKEDWELDRLVYFALNDSESNTCKLIKG